MNIVKFNEVEEKIIAIRDVPVFLDSDVAELYGVETKRINEAVVNNPEKFPAGYIIEISSEEHKSLRSKFSTLNTGGRGQHRKYLPKAFTEKGLYMLATILKSQKAVETTIAIVETFTRMRELSRTIKQIAQEPDEPKRNSLVEKGGKIIFDIIDNDLEIANIERSFEINLGAVKFKQTITRQRRKSD